MNQTQIFLAPLHHKNHVSQRTLYVFALVLEVSFKQSSPSRQLLAWSVIQNVNEICCLENKGHSE